MLVGKGEIFCSQFKKLINESLIFEAKETNVAIRLCEVALAIHLD